MPKMHRKVWVKRPNATATQVTINEEDLVDDVKDMILRKYTNSLGRSFDAPDVILKVILREQHGKRSVSEQTLAPEDNMIRTLEHHYPGGQHINEALIVDVPRRTPRQSPHMAMQMPYYVADQIRPVENGTDYFPPMPIVGPQSPNLPSNVSVTSDRNALSHRPPQHPHSISVLETGHVPNLPSPGSRTLRHSVRPRVGRQHTSSPTVISGNPHSGNHGTYCLSIPLQNINPKTQRIISKPSMPKHLLRLQSLQKSNPIAVPHHPHALPPQGRKRSKRPRNTAK